MDVKYINPVLSSIKDVFSMMLQMPVTIGKPQLKNDNEPRYDISCIIGLSGSITGSVVITLSEEVAFELASALSGEEVTKIDEDCIDAIGEIANMIAGGAKKDFPGDNSISVPGVVVGKHKVMYPKGIPIISIPCDTAKGMLLVDIAFKESNVCAGAGV